MFENGRFAARHVRCDGYLVGLGVGQVAGGRFRLLDGHGAEGDALESQLRVLHDALRGHVFAAVKVGGLVLRAVERCGSLWLGQQGFGVFLDEREIHRDGGVLRVHVNVAAGDRHVELLLGKRVARWRADLAHDVVAVGQLLGGLPVAALVGGELRHEASALVDAVDRAGERVLAVAGRHRRIGARLVERDEAALGQPPVHGEAGVGLAVPAVDAPHVVESHVAGAEVFAPCVIDRCAFARDGAVHGGTRRVGEHDDVARLHGSRRERGVVVIRRRAAERLVRGAERRDGVRSAVAGASAGPAQPVDVGDDPADEPRAIPARGAFASPDVGRAHQVFYAAFHFLPSGVAERAVCRVCRLAARRKPREHRRRDEEGREHAADYLARSAAVGCLCFHVLLLALSFSAFACRTFGSPLHSVLPSLALRPSAFRGLRVHERPLVRVGRVRAGHEREQLRSVFVVRYAHVALLEALRVPGAHLVGG